MWIPEGIRDIGIRDLVLKTENISHGSFPNNLSRE